MFEGEREASLCEETTDVSENGDTSLKCSEAPMYKGDSTSEVLSKDLTKRSLTPHSEPSHYRAEMMVIRYEPSEVLVTCL